MPYLIITDKQHEIDRHELHGPVVVGRSPDCDVVVRDVLLSRHHCRIEQQNGAWVVTDLGSKNGTFIETHKIDQFALSDADIIRAGRTRIIFKSGKFIPPPPDVLQRKAARRPADPIEALSGTVMAFEFTDMEENSRKTGFPIPRPRPAEPVGRRHPIEHDMPKAPAATQPKWDLSLREAPATPVKTLAAPKPQAAPAPMPTAVQPPVRPAAAAASRPAPLRLQRDAVPQVFATSPQWLALLSVIIVYLMCALAVWLVAWR
jgi:predicted component of type VI protein secretion system